MFDSISQRLSELGLVLPELPRPQANYLPYKRFGNLVFLAGQTSIGQVLYQGTLSKAEDVEAGYAAARQCGVHLIAALKMACDGDLSRVQACLKVNGYVQAAAGFDSVPAVINGTSDLFVEVFGEAGTHARTAIGVSVLPRDASVEVEAVFAVREH
ncbi:RidA family protein [Lampropedia puyangensis]|uniref:RidA family protein n=1 Tax=Lampropedia puyangensis TaxID=1330072 RepID=A0A4S8FBM1_9BURK|nr:RidA family protein [Lampropedia puyangensis]THU04990.1 RidA family protein [Lampropedia puyangensis]